MKSSISIILSILSLTTCVFAGAPVAQITFRLTDDSGNIVTGAPVTASTFLRWVPGEGFGRDQYDKVSGLTDSNGLVVLNIPSKRGSVRYSALDEGTYFDKRNKMLINGKFYYLDKGGAYRFTERAAGKWQPWNPTVDIVIKPVLKPIPMYARAVDPWIFRIPEYSKPLGFDLEKSDWLPPHGEGEIADFIFQLDCNLLGVSQDKVQYFDATLKMSFSNDGDGIQEIIEPPREGSALRLPRYAPETGYKSDWEQKAFEYENSSQYSHTENQNYIFRIRTKKDEKGEIISALYGKIIGPIVYEVRTRGANMQMKYYLNPTPNDRNLEFDPSKNLLENLPVSEQVREP